MHLLRALGVLLAMSALFAFPALTSAHAHLESTDPEAGASLDEPPTEVTMTFDGELRHEGSGFTVTDADGHEVGSGELDLDVAERNVLRGTVEITEPGAYTVRWQIVAEDGHPDTGEFGFGYQADADTPHDDDHHDHSAPDTAVAQPDGTSGLTVIGVLLLISGVALAARRLILR